MNESSVRATGPRMDHKPGLLVQNDELRVLEEDVESTAFGFDAPPEVADRWVTGEDLARRDRMGRFDFPARQTDSIRLNPLLNLVARQLQTAG